MSISDPQTEPQAPRRRHVIAVGGGRGGVGKTLLAVNLSVYLAQLGRNVVLCDADPFGSNLHTSLGCIATPLALPEAIAEHRAGLVATTVPGLKLLPAAYDVWAVAPKRTSRKSHLTAQLSQLDADYVVLNLGASTRPSALDVFHEADVGICVAAPEPPAIEATYRYCRALFARRLRRIFMRDRLKLRVVERALAALAPLPTPRAIISEIARFDEAAANVAAAEMQRLRPRLVIGKSRLRRDHELGTEMSSLSERYLGIHLDYMGYIEQDDAVWLTARRRRPLLIDSPTSKAARNIERVARRLLALLAQQQNPTVKPQLLTAGQLSAPVTLYHVLGVARTAADDEIRRAYKLQREIFREDSLPIVSLVDDAAVRREQAHISEAYDTLLDPARRRAYDMSVFPDEELPPASETERKPIASEAELAELQAEVAREVSAETQFSGALLAKARRAQGLEVEDVAQTTKISALYLRAIEAEDFQVLPAQVYVRGFLRQIAKTLKLDPTQVTKTYLKGIRSGRSDYE